MNKLKSLLLSTATVLILSGTLTSCLTTKTNVGTYAESQGPVYTYAKGKQLWLFWGIIPVGRTNVDTPGNGNCQIVTKFTFGDALISVLTGGVVTSYMIKVKAKVRKE